MTIGYTQSVQIIHPDAAQMHQRTAPPIRLCTHSSLNANSRQLSVHTSIRQIFIDVFVSTDHNIDRLIERQVKQIVLAGLHKLPTIRLHYNQLLQLRLLLTAAAGDGEPADGCCRPSLSSAADAVATNMRWRFWRHLLSAFFRTDD